MRRPGSPKLIDEFDDNRAKRPPPSGGDRLGLLNVGQVTFSAVSSTTKLVCSDESSFIRNFTEIVEPL